MSDWQTYTEDGETLHELPGTKHRYGSDYRVLRVAPPRHGKPWSIINLVDGDDKVMLFVDHETGETEITHAKSSGGPEQRSRVADPSSSLLSLIASHHKTKAWMPLLDKLAEEYPEHFEAAVAAHTVARNADTAEHYARAFTEAMK